ncbi:hypothetical protein L6R46_13200 [Myxococcota bacterium]|nr:hypothetical protein [Myxococcota bacterium]
MLDRALITLPLSGGRLIDSYDPRFAELADGVLRGRYIAAAEGAGRLLAERFYDVRLISYFVFGVVLEQGVGGLGWALDVVMGLARSGWEGLGPAQGQQKHVKSSVRWLLEAISRRLAHLEDDPQGWARFMAEWDDERRAALIDAADALAVQLDGLGDLSLTARRVVSALRTLAVAPPPPLVEPTPPQAPPIVEEDAAEEEVDEDADEHDDERDEDEPSYDEDSAFEDESPYEDTEDPSSDDPSVDAPSSKGPHTAAPRSRTDRPRLIAPPQDAAPAWGELMERLTLFEQLVADGATTQAAVVADDIEERLNHFDPRRYFPALFAGYYAALADNMEEIEEAWEARESARWRVLRQLYQLDPERFRRAR